MDSSIDSHSLLQPLCEVKRKRSITTMNDLPDGVLMEILVLLSLPSVVLRCKWVSKRWFSLISTPYFARRFVTQHPHVHHPFSLIFYYPDCCSNRRLLITTNSETQTESELKPLAAYLHNKCDPNTSSLRASCNDLLLWCDRAEQMVQHCPPVTMTMVFYSIINPFTRQCLALPPRLVPHPHSSSLGLQVGIICSYDYNNDDQLSSSFRVVLIPWSRTKFTTQFNVHIFSSDTGEWSDSVVLCPPNLDGFKLSLTPLPAMPYKGFLFWSIDGARLLGFDPYNSTCCCVIERPVQLEQFHEIDCLGLCCGCLRTSQVSGYPYRNEHPCLRVWDLMDFDKDSNNNGGGAGGKWCLRHELYFNQMVSEKSPWLTQYVMRNFPLVSVLAFDPNDADIMYLTIQSKVVLCNLQSRTLEVFCDIPQSGLGHHFIRHALTFVLPSWPTPLPFTETGWHC